MSWSLKDTRSARPERETPPPPPEFHDDEPLPSHAYFAGMDEGDEDAAPPGWGALRVVSEEQGMLTPRALERYAWLMTRGITASTDDPEAPQTRSAHEAPPGWRP